MPLPFTINLIGVLSKWRWLWSSPSVSSLSKASSSSSFPYMLQTKALFALRSYLCQVINLQLRMWGGIIHDAGVCVCLCESSARSTVQYRLPNYLSSDSSGRILIDLNLRQTYGNYQSEWILCVYRVTFWSLIPGFKWFVSKCKLLQITLHFVLFYNL